MQTPRQNQATFFGLAVPQRGAGSRVLETITREVNFRSAAERVITACGQGGHFAGFLRSPRFRGGGRDPAPRQSAEEALI